MFGAERCRLGVTLVVMRLDDCREVTLLPEWGWNERLPVTLTLVRKRLPVCRGEVRFGGGWGEVGNLECLQRLFPVTWREGSLPDETKKNRG